MKIPESGTTKDEVLRTLRSYKVNDLDWKSGRVFGYVYDPGEETTEVINESYLLYLSENGLDPLSYPSLMRLETEVVAMVADLLSGDQEVVGSFTTGGTESLMLAVKTARDWARVNKPGIKQPEFVLPFTAHSSFHKAAHYLGVKPVTVPVEDGSYVADVAAMARAITDDTILLVGSAPSYAHGVVDPIPEIGRLARTHGLLFHVDACVGGIHLSYMRKLGYPVKDFDFHVPGVTSLSVDMHKYGYAAKPASIILYRNKELRKHQFFACSRWPGYTVINPTMTSSKSGGPLAASWAVLKFLGNEGYQRIVREVMEATRIVIEGVSRIEGLRVLGHPDMCMLSLTTTTEKFNTYKLADEMKLRGWYLQPQFSGQTSPASLHISLNRSSAPRARELVRVLEECVRDLMNREQDPREKALQTEMKELASNLTDENLLKLAVMSGAAGPELPQRMERVNLILDMLPDAVAEMMLIEFLNNAMVLRDGS